MFCIAVAGLSFIQIDQSVSANDIIKNYRVGDVIECPSNILSYCLWTLYAFASLETIILYSTSNHGKYQWINPMDISRTTAYQKAQIEHNKIELYAYLIQWLAFEYFISSYTIVFIFWLMWLIFPCSDKDWWHKKLWTLHLVSFWKSVWHWYLLQMLYVTRT